MIISILTRKARLNDRTQWEAQLARALPRINELLWAEPGFVSAEYLWSTDNDAAFAQITTWKTLADCQRYVRGGAAANVATIEEAAIPTALHPNGAWVRKTFEIVQPGSDKA